MLDQLIKELKEKGEVKIFHNGHRLFDLEIRSARKGEVNIGFMGNQKAKAKYKNRLVLTRQSKHLKDIIN